MFSVRMVLYQPRIATWKIVFICFDGTWHSLSARKSDGYRPLWETKTHSTFTSMCPPLSQTQPKLKHIRGWDGSLPHSKYVTKRDKPISAFDVFKFRLSLGKYNIPTIISCTMGSYEIIWSKNNSCDILRDKRLCWGYTWMMHMK
jgi:hypothetical protein